MIPFVESFVDFTVFLINFCKQGNHLYIIDPDCSKNDDFRNNENDLKPTRFMFEGKLHIVNTIELFIVEYGIRQIYKNQSLRDVFLCDTIQVSKKIRKFSFKQTN